MATRMHDDEIAHDAGLVRRLVARHRPEWAHLPVHHVPSTGTDIALYRLGDDLVVRLPLRPSSTRRIDRIARWLPVLAPHLPLAVPAPAATVEPSDHFPWAWSIMSWVDGVDAATLRPDPRHAVDDLAGFIAALHAVDGTGGPVPSAADLGRGVPLATRDHETRRWIERARGMVDVRAVTAVWEDALWAPAWDGPPVWLHGDLASGNLLVRDDRISAVIDWATVGLGDPAFDLLVAWEMFDAAGRDAFRAAVGVDDATWARGRGWALSTAVIALPYYEGTNAFMAEQARRKIAAVLDDGS